MRQVVLDTETTGLETAKGHRIIEIGGVELIDRKFTGRQFHKYTNPDREIDDGAFEVHGINSQFLADKPRFRDIAEELLEFITGAELIIHNAPFDVSFLDYEFSQLQPSVRVRDICQVTDSLALAKHKHPGQKNNLDSLCRRYAVDNSARTLHGALLDAEILADVYLLLTGGQTALFDSQTDSPEVMQADQAIIAAERPALSIVNATAEETTAHESALDMLDEASETGSVWRQKN